MKSEKIIFTFAIIFLVITIILLPLRSLVFNERFYHSQFEKNNVYETVEAQISEADSASEAEPLIEPELVLENLINFFKGKESLNYFSETEQSHLEDVRVLFNKFFFVLNSAIAIFIALIITLFYLNKKEFKTNFLKIIFLSGLSSFALLILLFLATINFSATFDSFHKIFFSQGNYLFSKQSLLIRMFPETFFFKAALRIFLDSLFSSIILMGLFFLSKKK